jgi:CO dehydrogenase maturation factor
MDMEAGIEHLGRATAKAVDKLIVVVEPGRRSIDTAEHIRRLAAEIQLDQIYIVGNKVRGVRDEEFLRQHLEGFNILGFLPYTDDLIEADLRGASPYDVESAAKTQVREMIVRL